MISVTHDDGPAVVAGPVIVDPVQPDEDGLGQNAEQSPIDDLRQLGIHLLEDVDDPSDPRTKRIRSARQSIMPAPMYCSGLSSPGTFTSSL